MRKLLSILLTLVLCIGLMPLKAVPVHAATDYDLWIAGTRVTSENAGDLSVIGGVSGTASYDAQKNTLELKGATISNSSANPGVTFEDNVGILYKGNSDFTISLEGDNSTTTVPVTLTGGSAYTSTYGVYSTGRGVCVTFTGSGTLIAKGGETTASSGGQNGGICITGPIVIDAGTTVTASADDASQSSQAVYAAKRITINGTLTAESGDTSSGGSNYGIFAEGGIVINDGAVVTAKAGEGQYSYGIRGNRTENNEAGVIINGGTVNATSGAAGVCSYGIDGTGDANDDSAYAVEIHGGSVTAAGGAVTGSNQTDSSIGIHSYWHMIIDGDAEVTATGGNAENPGYYSSGSAQSDGICATIQYYKPKITIGGTAVVNATGGKAVPYGSSYSYSRGIFASFITIEETPTVNAVGGESEDYSYGIMANEDITIDGGTIIAYTTATSAAARALSKAPVLATGLTAAGSTNASDSGAVEYAEADNDTYKWFKSPFALYEVAITRGANMLWLASSGEESQIVSDGTAITDVVYIAADGYYFPESYPVDAGNGITIIRDNPTRITVSGTPTKDVTLTLADASEIPAVSKVDAPIFNPPSGKTFTDTLEVTISIPDNATVYYTKDKTEPSDTNGIMTTGAAITLDETTTLKAIAISNDANYDNSDVVTATYTKNSPSTGGGGGGTTTYAVSPAEAENGKITVSPKNAAEGDKVTITVTPDEGYELDKLTVKDKDGNEIKVTENEDGTFTITMPASEIEVEATFKEAEEAPGTDDGFPFVDVPEEAYYRKPVEWAVENDITSGVSEDKYGPELSCTRAQVVTFLWITCGSEDAGTETGFDDVDVDAYYDKAVAWAVEQGITAGTSENEFSPEMTITRAQFVTMLWAAKGKPEPDGEMPFKDVPEDAYYAKAVAWAYANDITAGKSADSFAPDDPCTRGQIMTFLYNAYAE